LRRIPPASAQDYTSPRYDSGYDYHGADGSSGSAAPRYGAAITTKTQTAEVVTQHPVMMAALTIIILTAQLAQRLRTMAAGRIFTKL